MVFLKKIVMKKQIYKFIFFKIGGWRITSTLDSNLKKCILMVVPHTSWHDFFLGIFTRGITGLDMHYVAKKELFVFPIGWFFKWTGGAPLNRGKNENKVQSIAKIFDTKSVFRLAIAPEGTRKKVEKLKTGFYYIAKEANVPIVPVAFDYKNKQVVFHKPFIITEDETSDLIFLNKVLKGVEGKIPQNSY